MTLARMIRIHKLPDVPYFSQQGLREMEEKDLPEVTALFSRYMQRFDMAPEMTLEDAGHHFLSGRGEEEIVERDITGRKGQVVWSYVVEVGHLESCNQYSILEFFVQNPETHKITDFFTFYCLPSTIINNTKHGVLEAAYLYYYATDTAFEEGAEESSRLKKRLEYLIGDALIVAYQAKFDVFNALTLMDNVSILKDLKVECFLF